MRVNIENTQGTSEMSKKNIGKPIENVRCIYLLIYHFHSWMYTPKSSIRRLSAPEHSHHMACGGTGGRN